MFGILLSSYANDSFSYRESGSGLILLTKNEGISMSSELLKYDYNNKNYEITYTFENLTTNDQDITIAFPVSSNGYDGYEMELYNTAEEWMQSTYHFVTEIDGISYERELMKLKPESATIDYDYAFVLDISIPSKSDITIIDKYGSKGNSEYYYDYFYPNSNDLQTMIWYTDINQKYILETANSWSGTITDFETVYSVGFYSNFFTLGNDIYFFNNNQFQSIRFDSNYNEMNLEYSENADTARLNYTMDFNNFEPIKNLESELIIRKTDSINALTFSGTIFEYLNSNYYNIDHINYMLDMIFKIFPQDQFNDILFNAILKMDKYYNDNELRDMYFSDHKSYIATEIVTLSRFFLNKLFAQEGYVFNSEKWNNIFSYFDWYNPTTKNVSFNSLEESQIEKIKQIRSTYSTISEEELSNDNFLMPKLQLQYQGK